MSKRIFRSICLVTVIVLIVSMILIMGSTYDYFTDAQEQHIKNQMQLVSGGVELSGEEYFKSLEVEDIRITWIAPDGTVLFDNEKDPREMGNHLEREEVQAAIHSGTGESSRYSSTLLEKQFYCAKLLSDGSIIRISDSQSTVVNLLLALVQPICIVLAVIVILAFVVARDLSKKIVKPINNIDTENPLDDIEYEELKPLLSKLSAQHIQLEKDRAELEKTERIRQEFTTNVSHELKTPLHAISGYAELMKNGLVDENDIKPFAEKIYDESNRLSQLVTDVIDLSKLDSTVPELESEKTDLYRIAENVIDSLGEFADEKKVTITLKGSHAELFGIPQQLHSIIFNLCDNAIKYNREGGLVKVGIDDFKDKVLLTVSDTGIGIPEEYRDRIFERFFRIDKSHSKELGGTGLGLSIVKHAAAIHNASIKVDSEPGNGTVVTISFPKNRFYKDFTL